MASGQACIAEVEVVLACQSSCRERIGRVFFFFWPEGGGFSRGITFCSFQLVYFLQTRSSAWRIEVSPSRIKVTVIQPVQVINNLSEVLE